MGVAEYEINVQGLDELISPERTKKAQALLAVRVRDDSQRYVPVDTGALQEHAEIGEDRTEITYTQEYAKYVYEMDKVISAGNPMGSPHWFDKATEHHVDEWKDLVADVLENG